MKQLMVAMLLLVAGCSAGTGAPAPTSASAPVARSPVPSSDIPAITPSPTATRAVCNETSVILGGGFPEVRGTARNAELWGLLFAPGPPLASGEEIKIVWRMTGEGPLRVRASLADGTPAKLAWGPEEHSGSNWQRPGQEWGTGFVFPRPGCWKIELTRTRGSGYVWLSVK
ncbi:hypothetical protein [Nonomuraea sp. NPDC050786]|uniref:hypothetical protein n=1 Tax=Nonomuraea sp. NPDC050786 TaxID=3154840 RepID=UPI00340E56F8